MENTIIMEIQSILSIVELILIAGSVYFLWMQLKILNNDNSLKRINELEDYWGSVKCLEARQQICSNPENNSIGKYEYQILGFFEKMGLYYSKRILDRDSIWDLFGEDILYYFSILESNILELRNKRGDETYYDKFEELNDLMKKEYKKRIKKTFTLSSQTKQEFLDYECDLVEKV